MPENLRGFFTHTVDSHAYEVWWHL